MNYRDSIWSGIAIASTEVERITESSPQHVICRNVMIEIQRQFASGTIQAGEVHLVIQGAATYFREIADDLDMKSSQCIAADGRVTA